MFDNAAWLASFVPWWAWVVLAIPVLLGVRHLTGSWRYTAEILIVIATLGAASKFYSAGWRDRQEKGRRDALKETARADRAAADADLRNADPERLRNEDDGFKRDVLRNK